MLNEDNNVYVLYKSLDKALNILCSMIEINYGICNLT